MSDDELFGLGVALIVVLVIGGAVAYGSAEFRTDAACLALGYPKGTVTYNFVAYCSREENETEVVVRLDEARQRGRMKP